MGLAAAAFWDHAQTVTEWLTGTRSGRLIVAAGFLTITGGSWGVASLTGGQVNAIADFVRGFATFMAIVWLLGAALGPGWIMGGD